MKKNEQTLKLIDELALNLPDDFIWSPDLRESYEKVSKELLKNGSSKRTKKVTKTLVISFEEIDGVLGQTLTNKDFSPVEILGLLEYMKHHVVSRGFGDDQENEEL